MSDPDNHHEEIADPTAVIGHSDFVESLASSMTNGRMHHAWHKRSIRHRKTTVAQLAAAWLLSEKVLRDLFGAEVAGFSVSRDDPGPSWFSMVTSDYMVHQFLMIIGLAKSKLIKSARWCLLWHISQPWWISGY